MDGFSRQVLERLPLADAALTMWSYVLQDEFLDRVFNENRGRCYEVTLRFPDVVRVIGDALLEYEGSALKACRNGREEGWLDVTDQGFYGKLRRLPIPVSEAFLIEGAMHVRQLFPKGISSPVPQCFAGWEVVGIDGKKIKNVAKRLKLTRGIDGRLLGGKALVARSLHDGLAVAMHADPDGEVNDSPLVPGLLDEIVVLCNCSWVVVWDSQFCDLTSPRRVLDRNGHFVVRYHPKVEFHRATGYKVRHGVDSRGRNYQEDIGYLGSPKNPAAKRLLVRRIIVFRPGEEDLVLITSLLDMDQFPADDILTLYALRWTIETMFQHVTEVFCLKRLIGSTPEATVFQFSFCLMLYNMLQLVRAYLSTTHHRQPEDISMENVFDDLHRDLVALTELTTSSEIVSAYPTSPTAASVRKRLKKVLGSVWEKHWLKAPKNKSPRTQQKRPIRGGHTSVFRLIQAGGPQKVRSTGQAEDV